MIGRLQHTHAATSCHACHSKAGSVGDGQRLVSRLAPTDTISLPTYLATACRRGLDAMLALELPARSPYHLICPDQCPEAGHPAIPADEDEGLGLQIQTGIYRTAKRTNDY